MNANERDATGKETDAQQHTRVVRPDHILHHLRALRGLRATFPLLAGGLRESNFVLNH